MINISDYFNTSKINEVTNNFQNYTFQNLMSQGIFGFGFSPYSDLMFSFFWGITFAVIGIAVWSWGGKYPLIGYGIAITLVTGAILPQSIFAVIGLFVALCITAILYDLFLRKKGKSKELPAQYTEATQNIEKGVRRYIK